MEKLPEEHCYCRKCQKILPKKKFYNAIDDGAVDSNGKFSVCKDCCQKIYDELYVDLQSFEKTIHKMCMMLNVRFLNSAISSTKTHIETMISGGKNVHAIFSIYIMRLAASNPSMDKSDPYDMTYEDVGTIYVEEDEDVMELPIPEDVANFWGKDLGREEIDFLETQYANFRQTHKADSYAEKVLLRQVCFTMLDIQEARKVHDDTSDLVKELQNLMKNLAIAPKDAKTEVTGKGEQAFGLWLADIEEMEPAQWLKDDPRGDMYRDAGNVEEYFKKYITRPLKNFILQSKDFNVSDEDDIDKETIFDDDEEKDSLTIMKE